MAQKKKPVTPVKKPFYRGKPTDGNTLKNAAIFFGMILVISFMSFLVCSMTSAGSQLLRTALNLVIFALIQMIYYQRGLNIGTDTVAKSETIYQRLEKGLAVSETEKAVCYHPLKGFITAVLGTVPMLIPAVILALTAEKTITGYGTLPGWMEGYLRRSEVGDALVAYTVSGTVGAVDIIRVLMRVVMMPLVSMIGSDASDLTLLLERLSPLVMLIPAVSYGFGYTRGESVRTRIHTEIAENAALRKRREMKKRRKRMENKPKGPAQLN